MHVRFVCFHECSNALLPFTKTFHALCRHGWYFQIIFSNSFPNNISNLFPNNIGTSARSALTKKYSYLEKYYLEIIFWSLIPENGCYLEFPNNNVNCKYYLEIPNNIWNRQHYLEFPNSWEYFFSYLEIKLFGKVGRILRGGR